MQLYRRDLDYTFKTERELLPDFSIPQWVVSHNQHSYKIETLEGYPITGKFSLRHYDSLSSGREQSWRKHRGAIEREQHRREELDNEVEDVRKDGNEGPVLVELGIGMDLT